MNINTLFIILVAYLLGSGILKCLLVSCFYFAGLEQRGETLVEKLSNVGGLVDLLVALGLVFAAFDGALPHLFSFGDPFGMGSDLIFRTNPKSLLALVFSFLILGLVARFSSFYLHKDRHYFKFFALFFIFQTATALLTLSETFVSFFVGWELFGISSVLLISFYDERASVVKNSLRIFLLYKLSDILLFGAFAVAYHSGKVELFSELGKLPETTRALCALMVSAAMLIKTGGFPFIWLPRAMEGPTPSTAVFYGAIATHVPVLLLVSFWSIGSFPAWVQSSLIAVALVSIAFATLLSRIEANAKNALAYATVQNLMLIVIEGVLGLTSLAILHASLHCFYRLAQYMRSPSLLYEHHRSLGMAGRDSPRQPIYQAFCPSWLESTIFRWSMREFYVFPRIIRIMDALLGIPNGTYQRQLSSILMVNVGLFALLAILEWQGMSSSHPFVLLLGPSWVFAQLALLNRKSGIRHLGIVAMTVTSLLTTILYFDKIVPLFGYLATQLGVGLGIWMLVTAPSPSRTKQSGTSHMEHLMFVVALLVAGLPGPGTYYIFEKTIHDAMYQNISFAVAAFSVLSIITLAVVKNYSLSHVATFKKQQPREMAEKLGFLGGETMKPRAVGQIEPQATRKIRV